MLESTQSQNSSEAVWSCKTLGSDVLSSYRCHFPRGRTVLVVINDPTLQHSGSLSKLDQMLADYRPRLDASIFMRPHQDCWLEAHDKEFQSAGTLSEPLSKSLVPRRHLSSCWVDLTKQQADSQTFARDLVTWDILRNHSKVITEVQRWSNSSTRVTAMFGNMSQYIDASEWVRKYPCQGHHINQSNQCLPLADGHQCCLSGVTLVATQIAKWVRHAL